MNLLLSTLVLVAGLTQSSSGTAGLLNIAQPASTPPVVTSTIITNEDSFIGDPFLPAQAQETVLVVPTPDLPAESLAELTKDLTVMCRIFDKSLAPARAGTGFPGGNPGEAFRFGVGQRTQGTQGLYLDGYGALFFIHVDYPLVPTEPQEPSQAQAKESADTVWSATVKEMSGQPGEDQQAARNAQTYDPQKVENLKKAAIKTLAHASNIRMRRPQDVITLVVGALDDSRASSYRRYGAAGRTSPLGPIPPGTGKPQPTVRKPTAALLVMRVTKADMDAFAKGQLTLAQFTEKVQSLWSPIDQGAPAAGPVPATSSRR